MDENEDIIEEEVVGTLLDETIYVLTKDEVLIAVFNKDDENPIINPRIKKTQNAEATLTFSIAIDNPKWEQIKNPENLYVADGKVFSTNFEGCVTETITDSNENLISVTAYERQKLLTRKYVRAWNSETGFASIDTFMVVVLSNGNLALKNNGEYVNSPHLPGTSGYALDALLYGTGWTTGICDVEGTFDLETDQVDIYENILKIQQIWGGILVFDSVNKIVHHRDETKYLPYSGYEVKYQKNMQSLEKLYNNKIITELAPLGEGGLNIKSVNNGSEWLTNYSYTNSSLQGIENNPDITDPEQLKRWGERKLQDLCKPRKELTVDTIVLQKVKGHELEIIDINHIVDVIDYQGIQGREQLRVVGYDYGLWDYSDAVLELSDITLESTDIFKKTVSASNSVNDGTIDSGKVVDFFNNGQSISETIKIIDRTVEQNKSDLMKSDEAIRGSLEKIETSYDDLNNTVIEQKRQIAELLLTIEGLKAQVGKTGGSNLIRNSVGAFGNEYWEGNAVQYYDTDVMQNNESKSAFILQNGSIMQEINNIRNGTYNLSFNYKELLPATNSKVIINDTEYILDNENWTEFEVTLNITNNYFRIEFNSDTDNATLISDLLLVTGQYRQVWSQNANETNTDTVSIGQGIQVNSSARNVYTRIDADGNRTYNINTGEVVQENTENGSNTKQLIVREQAQMVGLLYQKIDDQVCVNVL